MNTVLKYRMAGVLKCRAADEDMVNAAQQAATAQETLAEVANLLGLSGNTAMVLQAVKTLQDENKKLSTALQNLGGAAKSDKLHEDAHPMPKEGGPVPMTPDTKAAAKSAERKKQIATATGRNDTERAMAFLASQHAGYASLDLMARVELAAGWLRGEDLGAPAPANPALARDDAKLLKLRAYPGRNDTERAMALLTATRAGYSQLDRLDQVEQASAWLRAAE